MIIIVDDELKPINKIEDNLERVMIIESGYYSDIMERIHNVETGERLVKESINNLIDETVKSIKPEMFFEKTNHIPKGFIIRNKRK